MLNPGRFMRSARDILLDAPTLFAHLPRVGMGRALGFCAWVAVCLALCSLAIEASQLRVNWSDVPTLRALSVYGLARFAEHAGRTCAVVVLSAVTFHCVARAFGGDASPAIAARTAGYGSAFLLYNLATALAASLTPFLELAAVVIATLIQVHFYFTCVAIAAVEHYGVSRQRGVAVAGLTVALLLPGMLVAMTAIAAIGVGMARVSAWVPH